MTLKPQENISLSSCKWGSAIIRLAAVTAFMATMLSDTAQADNRRINLERGSGQAQPELTNLLDANAVASRLATSYTDCRAKKIYLTPAGLTAACNDFKRVTRFGSKHGEGENPTDMWGNTVDWSVIAKWLGLEDWFNNYLTNQTRLIAQKYQTRFHASTSFQAEFGNTLNIPVPPCMVDNPASVRVQNQKPTQFQWFIMPEGGTLSKAAKFHGTSVGWLQYWNWISDPNKVEAGRAIWVIPGVK
jgi:hypothetical protein